MIGKEWGWGVDKKNCVKWKEVRKIIVYLFFWFGLGRKNVWRSCLFFFWSWWVFCCLVFVCVLSVFDWFLVVYFGMGVGSCLVGMRCVVGVLCDVVGGRGGSKGLRLVDGIYMFYFIRFWC